MKTNICCGNPNNDKNIHKKNLGKKAGTIGGLVAHESICEKGIPYFIGKVPQTCTSSVCPDKFRCVFSKVARNYYCCSKDNAGIYF